MNRRKCDEKGFLFYPSFFETGEFLADKPEEQLLYFRCLFLYAMGRPLPEDVPNNVRAALCTPFANIVHNGIKYDEQCAKNRENGAKGGRPPKDSKKAEATDYPWRHTEEQEQEHFPWM